MSQALSIGKQGGNWLGLAGAGGCVRLGSVAGIPVLLHWSWFVVAWLEVTFRARAYQSWAFNLYEYLALFGVVLLHEFGHAFACLWVGGAVDRIVLSPLGGVAALRPPPRPGPVLWSVAGGPLVNVVLLPISVGLWLAADRAGWGQLHPDVMHLLLTSALINGALLVFNILPVYPLDGGQILHALLWPLLGRGQSLAVVSFLGLAGGVALCGLLLWLGLWLAAAVTFLVVIQSGLGLVQAQWLARPGWEHLGPAVAYLRGGQYDRALAESTLAVELVSNDDPATLAMAHQRRGVAHMALGNYPQAVADLSQTLELAAHAVFYFTRGEIHLLGGAAEAALTDFTAALSIDDKYALAYHQRGEAYFQLGDHDRAWQDLDRARQLDPSLPEVYSALGDESAQKRKIDWAAESCEVCVQVVAAAGAAASGRAFALLQAGSLEEALRACDEAIRLSPELAVAHLNRSEANRLLDRLDDALADAERAVILAPALPAAFTVRGALRRGRRELDLAIADCTEALRLDPAFSHAYLERGLAHRLRGDCDRAIADYNEGLRFEPGSVLLHYFRAIAYTHQGRYALAIADYREVIRLAPDDVDPRNNLAHLFATCAHDEFRDGASALELARQACELSGWKNANVIDTLAAACAEIGDFEQAVHWQQKCLADPKFDQEYGEAARARLRLYQEQRPYRKQ